MFSATKIQSQRLSYLDFISLKVSTMISFKQLFYSNSVIEYV